MLYESILCIKWKQNGDQINSKIFLTSSKHGSNSNYFKLPEHRHNSHINFAVFIHHIYNLLINNHQPRKRDCRYKWFIPVKSQTQLVISRKSQSFLNHVFSAYRKKFTTSALCVDNSVVWSQSFVSFITKVAKPPALTDPSSSSIFPSLGTKHGIPSTICSITQTRNVSQEDDEYKWQIQKI